MNIGFYERRQHENKKKGRRGRKGGGEEKEEGGVIPTLITSWLPKRESPDSGKALSWE
jgi:hypothetical protein